ESRTFWKDRPNDLVQQFEYEYGITDNFGIEPGVLFHKRNADSFELESADMELRFNFREFDFDKLLPAINFEYERRIEDDEHDSGASDEEEEEADNEAELKGIVSWYTRDGEDFTVNWNVGKGFGGKGDHLWESEITLGYLRPFDFFEWKAPQGHELYVGVEFLQGIGHEHDSNLGPVVTWRATQHLHMLASFIFGLNDRKENSDEFRMILEWE